MTRHVRRVQHLTALGFGAALMLAACVDGGPDVTATDDPTTTVSTETSVEPTTTSEAVTTTETQPAISEAAVQNGPTIEADGYDFAAIDPVIRTAIEGAGMTGAGLIIVDAEDGVVYHNHWGSFSPEHISLVASASKMISAGVLLNLADQGVLAMDGSVAEITGWQGHNPEVTPAQLVSNSSGLVGLQPGYPPYLCQFSAGIALQECGEVIFTSDADDAEVATPDTEFRYGGGQWQVAGAVAEIASGKSWDELIDEIYVEPCGLETLGFNNHWGEYGAAYPDGLDPRELRPTENPQIEGGGYLTTGDYGKLLLMLLRDGQCGDTQVLSEGSLSLMMNDRIGPLYGTEAGEDFGYGLGWWVNYEKDLITDDGLYGAVPWLDLADGYGAYLAVEQTDWERPGSDKATVYDVVEEIMTAAGEP